MADKETSGDERQRIMRRIEKWNEEHPGEVYSTAADYRTGPSAKIIKNYYEGYDEDERLRCPMCSWDGYVRDGRKNAAEGLFDVRCPKCGNMLLIVAYPTLDQIRVAAERGNPEAQEQLAGIEGAESG